MDTLNGCDNKSIEIIPETDINGNTYLYYWNFDLNGMKTWKVSPTLQEPLEYDQEIAVRAYDYLHNCNIYDTTYLHLLKYDNTIHAGEDPTLCVSIDSFLLEGYPRFDSSFWTGKYVYKADSNYYYNTRPALNEKQLLYYYPNKYGCGFYDSFFIKVLDDELDPLADSQNICVTTTSIDLTSPYSINTWSGDKVQVDQFVNTEMDTGCFRIYLEAGEDQCNIVDSQVIRVFPEQQLEIIMVNAPVCFGDTLFLKGEFLYDYSSLASRWEILNGNGVLLLDSNILNNVYLPDETDYQQGKVSLKLWSEEISCPDVSKKKDVPLYYRPLAGYISTRTSGILPLTVYFTDESTVKNSFIQKRYWDLGNGRNSTEAEPFTTYDSAGLYSVMLVVQSSDGCEDTIIKENYINALPSGIPDLEKYGLTIYPNPFTNKIFIESESQVKNIRLINFEGKEILYTEVNKTQTALSTEQLPKGIYLLEIEMEGGELFRQAIIKN